MRRVRFRRQHRFHLRKSKQSRDEKLTLGTDHGDDGRCIKYKKRTAEMHVRRRMPSNKMKANLLMLFNFGLRSERNLRVKYVSSAASFANTNSSNDETNE
jgi:hypothetical protein